MSQVLQTPPRKAKPSSDSLALLFQSSIKKQQNPQLQCLLCLLCSSDCDSSRCANPKHVVCRQCAYQWNLDRKCPICKNDSFGTIRKGKKYRQVFESNQIEEQHMKPSRVISLCAQRRKDDMNEDFQTPGREKK